MEPTVVDLIVGVAVTVAQLLEDALAQEGVRSVAECGVEAVPRRYSRDGIVECEARVDCHCQLIAGEGKRVPLAHVVGLLDAERSHGTREAVVARHVQPSRAGRRPPARDEFFH